MSAKQIENGARCGQVSIVDMARQLSCAPSTISRALRDDPRISEAVRRKVKKLAGRLGYHSNKLASALLRGRDDVIGFIVPEVTNPVYHEMLRILVHEFGQHGMRVFLADSQHDPRRETNLINSFLERRAAGGVIVPVSDLDRQATGSRYQALVDQKWPFVLFGPPVRDHFPHVYGGDEETGRMIGLHLREQGVRRVVLFSKHSHGTVTQSRLKGLEAGLGRRGCAELREWSLTPTETKDRIVSLLEADPTVDAVVFSEVLCGMAAQGAIIESGRAIPGDVMVIVLDNVPDPDLVSPPITHVAMPLAAMIQHIVQEIMAGLTNSESLFRSKRYSGTLVIRASSLRK